MRIQTNECKWWRVHCCVDCQSHENRTVLCTRELLLFEDFFLILVLLKHFHAYLLVQDFWLCPWQSLESWVGCLRTRISKISLIHWIFAWGWGIWVVMMSNWCQIISFSRSAPIEKEHLLLSLCFWKNSLTVIEFNLSVECFKFPVSEELTGS